MLGEVGEVGEVEVGYKFTFSTDCVTQCKQVGKQIEEPKPWDIKWDAVPLSTSILSWHLNLVMGFIFNMLPALLIMITGFFGISLATPAVFVNFMCSG